MNAATKRIVIAPSTNDYFELLDEYPGKYNVVPSNVMPISGLTHGRPELVQAKWANRSMRMNSRNHCLKVDLDSASPLGKADVQSI